MNGVQFPAMASYFSLLHSLKTDFGGAFTPYPMGIDGSFHRGKAAGA
jgi:hypothetical protein